MKRYWLCLDVEDFSQCRNCRRNPENPDNRLASLEPAQQWGKPMTSRTGCADQMVPAGSARERDDA